MPNYGVSTGLPQLPAGLPDKEFNLVRPLYLAMNSMAQGISVNAGLIDFSQEEMSQQNQLGTLLAQNRNKMYVKAVTALDYGRMVNLYLDGGKIAAQYADSTDATKPAHGVVNQPLGIAAGDYGEVVIVEGYTQGIAGTTFGLYYYLSSNGLVQAGPPSAAGTIIQAVGFGLGSAGFYMHISSYFRQN